MAAALQQVPQEVLGEAVRAHAVEKQAHDHAAAGRLGKYPQEPRPGLVRVPDVELQVDVVPCPPDPFLQRRVEFPGVAQYAQAARGADGKLVDAGKQLQELAIALRQPRQEPGGGLIRGARRGAPARGARREVVAAPETSALEPVGAESEIDQRAEERDEYDRPEPRERGRRALFEQQKVGDECPGGKVADEDRRLHGVLDSSAAEQFRWQGRRRATGAVRTRMTIVP